MINTARYNKPATSGQKYDSHESATTNFEGGIAFKMTPEVELYTRCATALMGEPKFYDETGEGDKEIFGLVEKVAKTNPEFVLKLAYYCRHYLYLRTVPSALLVEACKYPESKAFVRKYTPAIVSRADELAEVVACYIARNGSIGNKTKTGMLCNPLKRGLAESFHNFNEYQFAKYDRDGTVKLKDVLKIVHPIPQDVAESELFKKIKNRTLAIPETWETVISTKGSTKENWESILPKMPFMARIRNLRNLLDKDVDVTPVITMLEYDKAVLGSKQFPYRFFSAYREIEDNENEQTSKVMDALETALEISTANIPHFDGTTFITSDNSGSMNSTISIKSKVKNREVANLLSAMAYTFCDNAIVSVFGEDFKVVNLPKTSSILDNMRRLEETDVGHATNAYKAIDYLIAKKTMVDRIIIFSDMQCYPSGNSILGWSNGSLVDSYEKYKRINPKVKLYSIDLAGYGTAQFLPEDTSVHALAGWSDKLLQFIPTIEKDATSILALIESIRLADVSERPKEADLNGKNPSEAQTE